MGGTQKQSKTKMKRDEIEMVFIEEYEKADEMVENGQIDVDKYIEIIDYLNEKVDEKEKEKKKQEKKEEREKRVPKTRIGFLKKITEIKKAKPSEFDGSEEIKKFIDKNYEHIIKASEFIEEEPHRLRRNHILAICATVILIISGIAWLLSGSAAVSILASNISIILPITGIVNQIIHSLIHYLRSSKDTTIINNLSKIKKSLKKININNLPKSYKKKISLMIANIEDAETDGIERIKLTSENAASAIYQRYMDGEITYTERDEMLAYSFFKAHDNI